MVLNLVLGGIVHVDLQTLVEARQHAGLISHRRFVFNRIFKCIKNLLSRCLWLLALFCRDNSC